MCEEKSEMRKYIEKHSKWYKVVEWVVRWSVTSCGSNASHIASLKFLCQKDKEGRFRSKFIHNCTIFVFASLLHA